MKRFLMATVALTALATVAEAKGLPKPISLVHRMKAYDVTHYTRGAQGGKSHGGGYDESAAPAEARKAPAAETKTAKKAQPQTQKTAD